MNAKDGQDQLRGAFQADPNELLRSNTVFLQIAGQHIGPPIQFLVRPLHISADDCYFVRGLFYLFFKQLMKTLVVRILCLCIVPLNQQLMTLCRGQKRQFGNLAARFHSNAFQQCLVVANHALNRACVKEIGIVFEAAGQPLIRLFHEQGDVKLADPRLRLNRNKRKVWQDDIRLRRVLQHKHHLEQRRVAQSTLRLELLHQFLKRQFLIGVGIDGRLFDLGQQLCEGQFMGQIRSQYKRIGKKSDNTLAIAIHPVGNWRPYQDVMLARVTIEQRLECRQQCHEQSRTFPLADRTECIRELF